MVNGGKWRLVSGVESFRSRQLQYKRIEGQREGVVATCRQTQGGLAPHNCVQYSRVWQGRVKSELGGLIRVPRS